MIMRAGVGWKVMVGDGPGLSEEGGRLCCLEMIVRG